ncbi:hypothetical protein OF83DRAFT_1156390 [Amylostereum chailletii]|nr:hypothetical protein OF83DRAFT_1156390 [Amylostereum chailletii]
MRHVPTDPLDPSPDVQRHSDLWFDDGDVVLRATTTTAGTRTLFKVDKRFLARKSAFFGATFAVGGGALDTGSEQYEGAPVLDMPGDAAEDVEDLLQAVYQPQFLFQHVRPRSFDAPLSQRTFPTAYAGALRLAAKYIFEDIHALLIQALRDAWPTLLQAWDARALMLRIAMQTFVRNHVYDVSPLHPDPIATIHLATEHDLPELLPAAYYDLSTITHDFKPDIVLGHPFRWWATLGDLTPEEKIRLLAGRHALKAYLRALEDDPFAGHRTHGCRRAEERRREWDPDVSTPENDELVTGWPCARGIERWWRGRFEAWGDDVRTDPLEWMRLTGARCEGIDEHDACAWCRTWFKGHIAWLREDLWLKLPQIFGLENAVPKGWGTPEVFNYNSARYT